MTTLPTWIEGTTLGINAGVVAAGGGSGDDFGDGPTNGTDCVFIENGFPPWNVWTTIDLAKLNLGIPVTAKGVLINGLLIITQGIIQSQQPSGEYICDLRCQFKRTGTPPPSLDTYCWQAGINLFAGVRQPASVWVAVDNLCFDFKWQTWEQGVLKPPGVYPEYPSYQIHCFVNGYLR